MPFVELMGPSPPAIGVQFDEDAAASTGVRHRRIEKGGADTPGSERAVDDERIDRRR